LVSIDVTAAPFAVLVDSLTCPNVQPKMTARCRMRTHC
jgi:hypothetical protein